MRDHPKIVVGLELSQGGTRISEGSRHALEQARWLAHERSGEIICAHSQATDRFVERADGIVLLVHEGVPEQGQAEIQAVVDDLLADGLRARFELLEAKPALALVRLVMREQADLLVVGRHDEIEEGRRIGSVASKLLRNCPSPVWIVKPGFRPCPERVLVATDRSPAGARALELGAEVVRQAGAELHVVHAFQITMEQQLEGSADTTEELVALCDSTKSQVRREIEQRTPGITATLHVACTTPVRWILDTIERVQPDVLVMGSISRGGIAGFLIGNTAESVLPRTSCSLLVVKPDDFVSPVRLEDRY